MLEEISDLLDEKDRTDEVLEKRCEILEKLEELENNQDFTVNVFEEYRSVVTGNILVFKLMDINEPSFPRRKSNITTWQVSLANARSDITTDELKAIEWNRGSQYAWLNPKDIRSRGKLMQGYFSSYSQAQTDLARIWSLTNYASSHSPEYGKSEKTSPKVNPQTKTTKICSAVLYSADNEEILAKWVSCDFALPEE